MCVYVVLKWVLFFLVGDVLFRIVRLVIQIFFTLLRASQFVAPAYVGLVVMRSTEKAMIDDKTNDATLKVQTWAHKFLSLPQPNRKISPKDAVTLGSLVMSFFILSPFIKFLALFFPFKTFSQCALGIFIYHPYFTVLPKVFKIVKTKVRGGIRGRLKCNS